MKEQVILERHLHTAFHPTGMTDADKVIEVLLLRAPLDMTLPLIIGAQRAIQGPLCLTEGARIAAVPSDARHFELMARSIDEAHDFVMTVPSLCGSIIAAPSDAPHLTLVEAPACLELGPAISHLSPRLGVVDIVSHIIGHDRESNRLSVLQDGACLRLRANNNSVPGAPDLIDGAAQPWEVPLEAATRMTRARLMETVGGLDIDLARVLGHRAFERSVGLAPLLAGTMSASEPAFEGYESLTDRAIAHGFGGYARAEDMAQGKARENAFRAQLAEITVRFDTALAQTEDPLEILSLAREATDALAAHGWRAEPRIMQIFEAALAKGTAGDPDHVATRALQSLHHRAVRKAYILK
ncbi:hypothetical protein [Actibacterium sp. 188UL27-1]|uniref:hypothetical protein n=1 Tax=Actibacterium sp. 188UL27-1 TaxID=2786961 RepID=UPI0019560985|nr:hypothetical protein [Actibacterium sp. 188UL27-1]MBM7068697.1 hypothetical protein [Actibacterium sp. 188UL27-1]